MSAELGFLNQIRRSQRGVTRHDPYGQASVVSTRTGLAGNARFDDSTPFAESWTDFSAWSSGSAMQISSGRVYSAGNAGNSGINHSFTVASGETMRAVFPVSYVNGGSGGVIIGVSSDTAGGAFTTGGTTTKGVYFNGNTLKLFNNGSTTDVVTPIGTSSWLVTLTVDETYITISCVVTVGSGGVSVGDEYQTRISRSGVTINNLTVFNSDSQELSGSSIGPGGARKMLATITPKLNIEGLGRTSHWTSSGNAGIRIALPTNYDSRVPSPVAICFHGNGSDERHWTNNANGKVVANALNTAGFIVLSAAYTPGTSTWGSQNGLDAYYTAWQYLVDRYAVGPVVFYANSMGGIESLLCLADGRIPGVCAWVGTSPTADLADNYANATFTSTINSAYNIPGGGNYATQTSGHDPMLMTGDAFRGLPMWFLAASDDTTVSKTTNTDAMANKVRPYSPEVIVTTTTGGHSFSFSSYATNIANYLAKAAAR